MCVDKNTREHRYSKNRYCGAGTISQWLRALGTPAVDLDSISTAHKVAHNHL